jgi:hypothetical protein
VLTFAAAVVDGFYVVAVEVNPGRRAKGNVQFPGLHCGVPLLSQNVGTPSGRQALSPLSQPWAHPARRQQGEGNSELHYTMN